MKRILLLIITLLFYSQAFSQWQIVSEMPVPVRGAKAVVQDTVIYIIGGYSDSVLTGTKTIQAYYPQSNQWKVLKDTIIVPRRGLSVESYGDSAYIFGGATTSNDSSYSIEQWGYRNHSNIKWINYNFNRSFASTKLVNNLLYIFGGYQDFELGDSLSYLVRFNMEDGSVYDSFAINDSFSVELPSHQMSAAVNNKIYLFGGVLGSILRKISYLDLNTYNWHEMNKTLSKPRASGVALVHPYNGQIVLIGGKNEESEALKLVEGFDTDSYIMEQKHSLLIPRSQHCAVIYQEWIYVFGGKNAKNEIVASVEKVNLEGLDSTATTTITDDGQGLLSSDFELIGNYPNPFNPLTNIKVRLSKTQQITINIYDIQGRKIKTLFDNIMSRGNHEIPWDATDDLKRSVTSGIYFYTVSSGNKIKTNRMLLIK